MAEEAIPGTPRIREVRIESGSERYNSASTRRGSFRAEAVTGFEGHGFRVPFKVGDNYDGNVGEFDIKRMEENVVELEKDLIMKELETLDFLEALGSTKMIVEDLKLELQQQALRRMENPKHFHRNPLKSPDLIFMEPNQASMNHGKTMDDDLAMIQSYVESLKMKTVEEKDFLGVASLAEELNSLRLKPAGPDQGKRFYTENPQCEQVKMVTETNDTSFCKQSQACQRTAEMRLVAARKMEEAARAAEALTIAEMTVLSRRVNQDGFCLQEPPRSPLLTLQALMNKDLSTNISRIELLRKLEEANEEVKQSKQTLEIASVKQLKAEDAFCQWNIESWKDQKAIRAKRSTKEDNCPRSSFLSHVNQHEPLVRNVLDRKQVPTIDEKQLVTPSPRRKYSYT